MGYNPAMFIPNATCAVERLSGHDKYGKPILSRVASRVPCAVVSLKLQREQEPPRENTSPTVGNAHENSATAILLFHGSANVAIGDRVLVEGGMALRAISIEPRRGVLGGVDHIQVEFERWASA